MSASVAVPAGRYSEPVAGPAGFSVRLFEEFCRLAVEFIIIGLGDERFDSNIEVIIYRVACELINNSLKHSGCSEIELSLNHDNDNLTLDYSDNGCGFDTSNVDDSGMGLSNIRSRVQSLSGKFRLTSSKGEGTKAHIVVSTTTKMLQLSNRELRRIKIKERNGEKS